MTKVGGPLVQRGSQRQHRAKPCTSTSSSTRAGLARAQCEEEDEGSERDEVDSELFIWRRLESSRPMERWR
jgi:hypothetical protein